MILDGTIVSSPIGELGLVAHGDRLVGLAFQMHAASSWAHLARHLGPIEIRPHDDPAGAATRLARYFAGDLQALDEQPVELHGTEFQRAIWNALRTIPVGTTWTYAEIAARIGRPSAVRAAGAANGANPVAVFVPCHRVIAADGTLWGYGGGLERKRWLLTHEGAERYRSSSSMTSLNFSNG